MLNLVNKRTGVSTWISLIQAACKLSHGKRFRAAFIQWVGSEAATPILAAWDLFCAAFELYQETDDNPFVIDNTGGEPIDTTPGA